MRCKACDSTNAHPHLDDWYCNPCAHVIKKTIKDDFTLEDIYRILKIDDDETTREIFGGLES